MKTPSTLAVLRIFARLSIQRFQNQLSSYQKLKLKNFTDGTNRTGTVHRSERRSWFQRLLSNWLLIATMLGFVMLSVAGLFCLIDVYRVEDSNSANVVVLWQQEYNQLCDAANTADETAREIAIGEASRNLLSESKLSDSFGVTVQKKFRQSGISGFRAATVAEESAGAMALISPAMRGELLKSIGLYFLLINAAVLFFSLGSLKKSLSSGNMNLDWLFNLPVSRRVLFLGKLLEYSVNLPVTIINSLVAAIILGMCGASFWQGFSLSLALGVSVAVTIAALRLSAEVFLTTCRNPRIPSAIMTSAVTFGSMIPMLILAVLNSAWLMQRVPRIVASIPSFIFSSPLSMGIGSGSMSENFAGGWWIVPVTSTLLLATATVFYAARATRFGLEAARATSRTTRIAPISVPMTTQVKHHRLTGMVRKELLQLRRQPAYAANVLIGPIVILIPLCGFVPGGWIDPNTISTGVLCQSIFGALCYLLICAASQSLGSEFKHIATLQSLPVSLRDIVRSKSRAWGAICILMALPLLIAVPVIRPDATWEVLNRAPLLLVSLWMMAEILFGTTALGASITGEQTVRFRQSGMLLPLMFGASITAGLAENQPWMQLGAMVFLIALKVALRDRQKSVLNWISEPEQHPTLRFDSLHALIILLAFNLVRDTSQKLLSSALESLSISADFSVSCSYIAAAILVWMFAANWLRKKQLRAFTLTPTGNVLRPSLLAATICCSVATFLVLCYRFTGLIDAKQTGMIVFAATSDGLSVNTTALLLSGMLILVAPIFEEWLFRGLLLSGLRNTLTPVVGMTLSCLIFTVEHQLASWPGVLALALCNQWLVGKTGRLWPAVLVHMTYNALVVALWNLPLI